MGVVSVFLTPVISDRNIPPQWRADRWELSRDGLRVREQTEALCGVLLPDTWIDFPDDALHPKLQNASSEQTTCFEAEVVPHVQRGRPIDL
ncbi:MAG: hypothetical protein ACI8RZ_007968 [Myxococcota bacterium]|jgi:hypothetical protein